MFAFDQCARELESHGYALLPLPALLPRDEGENTSVVARAFASARRALDVASNNADAAPLIDPSTDSGSWTGFHNAAVINGRYNQHRQGFVFSNGEMFDVNLGSSDEDGDKCNHNFEHDMNQLFCVMHDDVAEGVLRAIERRLDVPRSYFKQVFGPTNESSQWHMKRYDRGSSNSDDLVGERGHSKENDPASSAPRERDILLPVHTDPSLISVVILDRVGKHEGGMGLEVFHPAQRQSNSHEDSAKRPPTTAGAWKEISHHGHDVAVIFVGSVLSYLTKGQVFSAAKHRVVDWGTGGCRKTVANDPGNDSANARMAATLFVRPHANALMKIPPSPHLPADGGGKKNPPTFRAWNARVAKNYMKKKRDKKSKPVR